MRPFALSSTARLGVLALTLTLGAGCDSATPETAPPPPTPATTGTISGTITLPPGSPGEVTNTRVAIYTSFDDWNNDRFTQQTAAGADGSYTLANIVPGTYYMDAWKDNDGSGGLSNPDFFGVYGSLSGSGTNLTPIPVAAGSSTTVSFPIQRIGGPALTGGKRIPVAVVVPG